MINIMLKKSVKKVPFTIASKQTDKQTNKINKQQINQPNNLEFLLKRFLIHPFFPWMRPVSNNSCATGAS